VWGRGEDGADDLVGYPPWWGCPDGSEGEVPCARVDQLAGGGGPGEPGRAAGCWFLGGEEDLSGADDLGRVAADGGAVLVEDGALAAEVRRGERGASLDVRVLGDYPQG
jgi:hypothetical protein